MKKILLSIVTVSFTLCLPDISTAQDAPGEDNIVLTKKVNLNSIPLNSSANSSKALENTETPAWLDAKMARLQARAYSADSSGILTEENINTRVYTQGFRKTCIQTLSTASNSTAKYGPDSEPMAVVLRGDLVNFCR